MSWSNQKTKTVADHFESGPSEQAFHTQVDDFDPELDQEFLETLIAHEDADALMVSTFEGEFEEFLRDTPEMFEALTRYIEARSKLVVKKKTRGFWPIKGKSKNRKGRGKSFGKRSRDRDAPPSHLQESLSTLWSFGTLESRVSSSW